MSQPIGSATSRAATPRAGGTPTSSPDAVLRVYFHDAPYIGPMVRNALDAEKDNWIHDGHIARVCQGIDHRMRRSPERACSAVVTQVQVARQVVAHLGPLGKDADVYAWEEDESPYELIAKGFKARGMSTATIGVEETVRFQYVYRLRRHSPGPFASS